MKKPLIIVESPAKIKTLKKFLGSNYHFESSLGHVRDLPEKEFGIDIEGDFEPNYVVMPEKKKVIANLKKAAERADVVYLSPDPDREGESIAWHISQVLPPETKCARISFNSITKEDVRAALASPREIDKSLVDAQQARRLLDRIVGYKISPLINRRIQRGLSAGRVQSVALILVVSREKEIEAFRSIEYWNLASLLAPKGSRQHFKAALFSVGGKRVEKEPAEGKEHFLIPNREAAEKLLSELKEASYRVAKVEKKEKRRNPVSPFITSTLQQEASRHYGFSSSRTMAVAQTLYEGIDMGEMGSEGLITYMRTDSVRIAPSALEEARKYILQQWGPEYLPERPRLYSTKKSAQDAHEAIRPTNLSHPPEAVKNCLSKEQFLLYQLIWRRFLSSQMNPAVYDTLSADIATDRDLLLRATGSLLKFPGFLAVYEEKEDEETASDEEARLPPIEEGEVLELIEATADQAFTRPPPRYTEASLVKELEKSGIGRPSTYATIMNKIQSREYTVKESGRLKPTELGRVVSEMLETNFKEIMNVNFTAMMEDELEKVAANEKNWKSLLRDFWKNFMPTLEAAEKEAFVPKVLTDLDCPSCGAKLQKIWFRSKFFYGCSRYPECSFSAPIEKLHFDKSDYLEGFDWDQPCPKCDAEMIIRHGRYGAFLGCSRYPECGGVVQIPKKGEQPIDPKELPPCPAVDCPGEIVARRSRWGKLFYACSTYPDCDVIGNSVEELLKKYEGHPRTAHKKAKPSSKKAKAKAKKKRPAAAQPLVKLSEEMAEFVGERELARGEILKRVWDYIKKQQLQKPTDKKIILPDEKLAALFGSKEPVPMTKVLSLIQRHIVK